MTCTIILVGDGPPRMLSKKEALAYRGPGFVWTHVESASDDELPVLFSPDIPDVAANALVATETRPRCDRIEEGAIVNIRGPAAVETEDSDRLVSIRMWARAGKVDSVTRRPLAATAKVTARMEAGNILDPGDLVAGFAREISAALDPQVADCESELTDGNKFRLRSAITSIRSEAIAYRRFVAPDRDALITLAALDFDWLAEDDRLHIREAADRFARMAEELEAVRERSALLHEQLTDLRAEEIDQRALLISIVAFIFLPLTFLTGLLGMNVDGIPYAHTHYAFWGVVGVCVLIAVGVIAWFIRRQWLRR
ncbi:MAG TPA: CorA family divalent cation transporter [Allosphingosinicella sp.]|nr:CorA family divalent cation transporter [Allosphingosinicella sp.]